MSTYNLPSLRDAMSRAFAARQAPPDGASLIRSRLKGPPDDMNSPEAEPWKKALNPEPEFDHTLYCQRPAEPPSTTPPLPAPTTSSADSQNLPQPDSPVPTENGTPEYDQPCLEQRSIDQLQRNAGRLRFKEALLQDQKQFLADAHKNYTVSLNRLKNGVTTREVADALWEHHYNRLDIPSRQADLDWSQHELDEARKKHEDHQAWHNETFAKPEPPVEETPSAPPQDASDSLAEEPAVFQNPSASAEPKLHSLSQDPASSINSPPEQTSPTAEDDIRPPSQVLAPPPGENDGSEVLVPPPPLQRAAGSSETFAPLTVPGSPAPPLNFSHTAPLATPDNTHGSVFEVHDSATANLSNSFDNDNAGGETSADEASSPLPPPQEPRKPETSSLSADTHHPGENALSSETRRASSSPHEDLINDTLEDIASGSPDAAASFQRRLEGIPAADRLKVIGAILARGFAKAVPEMIPDGAALPSPGDFLRQAHGQPEAHPVASAKMNAARKWATELYEKAAREATLIKNGVKKVNDRYPINAILGEKGRATFDDLAESARREFKHLAEDPTFKGVPWKKTGYPDFTQYAAKIRGQTDFILKGMNGQMKKDIDLLREQLVGSGKMSAGEFAELMKTHTLHHVEDTNMVQLVRTDIHEAFKHTGGRAVAKELGWGALMRGFIVGLVAANSQKASANPQSTTREKVDAAAHDIGVWLPGGTAIDMVQEGANLIKEKAETEFWDGLIAPPPD